MSTSGFAIFAFLSFGLAEAVSGSLASLGNVVVRAPAVAAKWNEEDVDPRRLAAEADVDLVITSTLLRSGTQLRVTAQLLDASSSTLIGSQSIKGSMDDIFALEDALTNAVMALLAPQLTPSASRSAEPQIRRDVPASPRAFELFLRGMGEAKDLTHVARARDLFRRRCRKIRALRRRGPHSDALIVCSESTTKIATSTTGLRKRRSAPRSRYRRTCRSRIAT